MKILFSLHYPNPFPGAAWTRIEYFAKYFKNNGHQVSVIGVFSARALHKAGSISKDGIKIINITPIIMAANIFSLIFNILSSIVTSIPLLILLRPDITIISVPRGETAIGPYIAAKVVNSKVVIDYRDEWEDVIIQGTKSMLYRRLYIKLRDLMTRFYLHSESVIAVTDAFITSLSLRGLKNVKLLPNGADLEIFRPYDRTTCRKKFGFNDRDFILVFSGKIGFYYRLDFVLNSLKKFINSAPNLKLLIIGDGPDLEFVLRMSIEIGLKNKVYYLGAKNNKLELAQLLCVADVGLVPYDGNRLWENTVPAKAFEYLACGLPIIATAYRDSVLDRLLSESRVGLTSEPGSIDGFVEIMGTVYNDRLFLKEAGERAVLLVKEHFDREKIANEFLNSLRGVN